MTHACGNHLCGHTDLVAAADSNLPADDYPAVIITITTRLKHRPFADAGHCHAVPVWIMGVFLDQFRKTVNAVSLRQRQHQCLSKQNIPEWLIHGFSVAGSLLPALGFVLTIFVIGNRALLPWFVISYGAARRFLSQRRITYFLLSK
ncbi:MAG: hypothetical protein GPOALKHO_001787 [Sodalis sp.]|uniref:PTS sugar transporter subunit IIC n=1 Tax=Sodalis sp. (in: enterobacteria) TaxID=1898979 RepID=UPI0038732DAC|nr:MAG: hypothetical protein GPOALKHO_001787 [Sodalis sp.]